MSQLRLLLKSYEICHKRLITSEPTLKDAHVYCVLHRLSAQQYGPLLEKYIIDKYGFTKNNATDCTGDCQKKKHDSNTEIKVSLGGKMYKKFNYVQIRVHHDISYYLLTAYVLRTENVDDEGELFIFRVSHDAMLDLLLQFGSYAHGTKSVNGEITEDSLKEPTNTKEYALRTTCGDKCWNALMAFCVKESEL